MSSKLEATFVETDTTVGQAGVFGVKLDLGERAASLVSLTVATIRAAITLTVLGAFFFMLVGGVFAGNRAGPEVMRTADQEPSQLTPRETRTASHP